MKSSSKFSIMPTPLLRGLLLALCFPTLSSAHARSTVSETGNIFRSTLPYPKVPLPPSTTSVKCKCQPQVASEVSSSPAPFGSSNIQSRSDDVGPNSHTAASTSFGREIEIEIFKSENDYRKLSEKQQTQSLQGDSHNVHEPFLGKSYKSFRTAELIDPYTEIKNPPSEFLELGKSYGPFKGPRRRRKRRDANPPPPKNNKVFYVYSVKLDNLSQADEKNLSKLTTTTENPTEFSSKPTLLTSIIYPASIPNLSKLHASNTKKDSKFSERNIDLHDPPASISPTTGSSASSLTLEQAMSQAWLDYGPKSVPPPHLPQDSPVLSLPESSIFLPPTGQIPQNNRPQTYSYQFQRQGDFLTSPWDDRVTKNPVSAFLRESSRPGFFSPLLARYIDFEVNNHEAADFARKLLFGFVIGALIAAWIALGVGLGLFPLNLLFSSKNVEKNRANSDLLKRNTVGGLENVGNRVLLALEPDWLKNLEDRVKKNPQGHFIRTVAKCCVIPKREKVSCILAEKDTASGKIHGDPVSADLCGSDLIYNFQFGGDEDEVHDKRRVKKKNSQRF